MAEPPSALIPFYENWHAYHQLLIKALAPLSPEQLALRTAPGLRSVGENAAHIVGVRAGWCYYDLEIKDERLSFMETWNQPNQAAPSAAELVKGLETTWQVIQDTLNNWSIDDLAVMVQDTDDNGEVHTFTRQWVIWHLIEHDLHHGGEISLTLGSYGLSGINI